VFLIKLALTENNLLLAHFSDAICVFLYAKSAIRYIFGIIATLLKRHYRFISIAGHEIG
jgi:hypothetical protein